MNAHDEIAELAAIINDNEVADGGRWTTYPNVTADAILAAGYRKPRTITTVDEILLVEPGTILQGPEWLEETFKCTGAGTFYAPGSETEYRASEIAGRAPFTVLYDPTPSGADLVQDWADSAQNARAARVEGETR